MRLHHANRERERETHTHTTNRLRQQADTALNDAVLTHRCLRSSMLEFSSGENCTIHSSRSSVVVITG